MKWRTGSAVALLALAACATHVPTRYYTLSAATPPAARAANAAPAYRVAIGPVTLPEALDRPQIVLRVAPNRYAISDLERWAEPLKREIPRVIAEDIGQDLPLVQVAANFQYGAQDADYRVLIDVLRFESTPGASITLEAAWSVRDRAGTILRQARSVHVEKVEGAGIAALVGAHEKALAALASEIAVALRMVAAKNR